MLADLDAIIYLFACNSNAVLGTSIIMEGTVKMLFRLTFPVWYYMSPNSDKAPDSLLFQQAKRYQGSCSAMTRLQGVPAASSGWMCPRLLNATYGSELFGDLFLLWYCLVTGKYILSSKPSTYFLIVNVKKSPTLSKPKPDKSHKPLNIIYTNRRGLRSNFKDLQTYICLLTWGYSWFRFPSTRIIVNSLQGFHTCMVPACMFEISFPLFMTRFWKIAMSHLDWLSCIPPLLYASFTVHHGGSCV